MKQILLTIDTEFYISKNEILGVNGKNGIDDILKILLEFNIRATFFIDYYASKKWGEEIFSTITEKILINQHDIQLHLHPSPEDTNPYLWQYSKEEQNHLISESIEIFKRINNKAPLFFRAGAYSADDNTIDILKENKFLADSSFQFKQRRCKISNINFSSINRVEEKNNFYQIPVTVYKYNFFKERYNTINFEWCSKHEFKNLCDQIKNSDLDYFVLMMHSFGLLKRWNRKKISPFKSRRNKLRKFIKYAQSNNYNFVTISEFYILLKTNKINTSSDFLPEIKNPLIILSGLSEKLKNRLILKKNQRYFAYAFAGLTSLVFFLLIYLLAFRFIEPEFSNVENTIIDTESWNLDNDPKTIEDYFISLEGYKPSSKAFEDKKGILYRNIPTDSKKYIILPDVDSLYIATDMSSTIIKDYSKFKKTSDSVYYNKILDYSIWLKENVIITNNKATWPHPYKFTKYNIDFNWCGSWALGNILSAISRRIQISSDSSFINLANQIVNTFETEISNDGILFKDDQNDYWYEEYPSVPPSHVLNGHITGLLGLYDYWRISENHKAKLLFDKGVNTIINNLDKFDSGYWSLYDNQYPYVADYFYHKAVHIPQLKILYQITGNKIFKDYQDKWEKYFNEPYYSLYKLRMIYDGFHRRFTYKSFFTLGK